jgi:hypothetical protein
MVQIVEGAVIGFAVGVFCPAIARKVKALFVKEATVVKADVKSEAVSVEKKF